MSAPLHLKIFVSSPGDVQDERNLARKIIKEELPYEPSFRGKVTFDVLTWDDPAAGVPMLATMTPQEAVNSGLGRPADCDITVVILWSRLGSPLPRDRFLKDNGEPYLSGTEWEFEDARKAGREVLVYQRTTKVLLDDEAPDFEARREQKRRVREFFAAFANPDGSHNCSVKSYVEPGELKERLALDLKTLIERRLPPRLTAGAEPIAATWQGSPYPGLRPFTKDEAPIFYGRDREIDALLVRVRSTPFVAIIGASGSGKS